MGQDVLLSSADAAQIIAAIIGQAAYFPQISKIIKSKSTGGLAICTWCGWLLCNALSLFYAVTQYAVHGVGMCLIFTTATNGIFVGIVVFLLFKYGGHKATLEIVTLRPDNYHEISDQPELLAA